MERVSFQVAVQVARGGDRQRAYTMMRQVLLEDPSNAFAWLWMSRLVDDAAKRRECLQRVLVLDPGCKEAVEELETLRLRDVMAASAAPKSANGKADAAKLGEYLIQKGLITQAQLSEALSQQARTQNYLGERMLLGDILIQRGWLSPQKLGEVLVTQQQQQSDRAPRRLGEMLMMRGFITPEQLARVLAQQSWLHQRGEHLPIGEILVRSGFLSPSVVSDLLDQQSRDFFKSHSSAGA